MQRSSSYAGESQQRGAAASVPAAPAPAAGKTPAEPSLKYETTASGGRLPRPRSAIVTRESAAETSTTALPLMILTTHDDAVTTAPSNYLAVPSSWYRTELAANVGHGSRRLTANVQLGLPSATTTSPAEVIAYYRRYVFNYVE